MYYFITYKTVMTLASLDRHFGVALPLSKALYACDLIVHSATPQILSSQLWYIVNSAMISKFKYYSSRHET